MAASKRVKCFVMVTDIIKMGIFPTNSVHNDKNSCGDEKKEHNDDEEGSDDDSEDDVDESHVQNEPEIHTKYKPTRLSKQYESPSPKSLSSKKRRIWTNLSDGIVTDENSSDDENKKQNCDEEDFSDDSEDDIDESDVHNEPDIKSSISKRKSLRLRKQYKISYSKKLRPRKKRMLIDLSDGTVSDENSSDDENKKQNCDEEDFNNDSEDDVDESHVQNEPEIHTKYKSTRLSKQYESSSPKSLSSKKRRIWTNLSDDIVTDENSSDDENKKQNCDEEDFNNDSEDDVDKRIVQNKHESKTSMSKRRSTRLRRKNSFSSPGSPFLRKKRLLTSLSDSIINDEHSSNDSDSDNRPEDDVNESDVESDGVDDDLFKVNTRTFTARFNSQCELLHCGKQFITGKTQIIGVCLRNPLTGNYYRKDNKKNYHICAAHSKFSIGPDKTDSSSAADEIDSEPNSSDDNFVDKSDVTPNDLNYKNSPDFTNILETLSRSTPDYKERRKLYMEEQGKYQLEIHKDTNPANYLSPSNRARRNLQEAYRDIGFHQERGLTGQDLEFQKTISTRISGKRVEIIPKKKMKAKYAQRCSVCHVFMEKGSWIVGAMLCRGGAIKPNDQQKPYWICARHMHDVDNTPSSDFEEFESQCLN